MKIAELIIVAILSIVMAFGTTTFVNWHQQNVPAAHETAFERIMRTNTLRCGYAVATPWFVVDPNTKKLSGVSYDMTEAVAAKIGLKVDWVEETGWGVAEQGLVTGRYDMLCGNVCIDPRRARAATFSTPFLHNPIFAVTRPDDKRFDANLRAINDPAIRIGVKSGHVFEFIANEQFPAAQKIYANDISDDTDFFQMLTANKVDVVFVGGQGLIDLYNEKNPDKVKALAEPVRFCNAAFMLPLGDEKLKYMIDNAITELNTSGQIKEILGRFIKLDPRYVRMPALPYQ